MTNNEKIADREPGGKLGDFREAHTPSDLARLFQMCDDTGEQSIATGKATTTKTTAEQDHAEDTSGRLTEFCETQTAANLTRLFRVCHSAGEMGIVTGQPGVGKTTAAQRYVESTPRAYLVTISPATSALVPCLTRIGECFGAFSSTNGASPWSEAIRRWLRVQPEPPLLLIDEAHHLSDAAVEELRSIFDDRGLGLVFIGSSEIRERWTGPRWAQLASRVYQSLPLKGPEIKDVDAICDMMGLPDRKSRSLLNRAARQPGGLRVVRRILEIAIALAGPGNLIRAEHIDAALTDRGLAL